MTTEDYITNLRETFGCEKADWDRYLRYNDEPSFQEVLLSLTGRKGTGWKTRLREIREMSPTERADCDMIRIVELVKKHLTPLELSTVADLHFAQIWTSSLNGLATIAPSGDRVVLINRGCSVAFAYAAIAFTDSYFQTQYSNAGEFIREDVQLFVAAIEAIGGPDISNHVNVTDIQKRVLLADPHKTELADMLWIALVCFVIAHELAHHILGHQGEFYESELRISGKPLSFYRYSRLKEYEADNYAWSIFRRVQTEMMDSEHGGEALSMSKYSVVAPLIFMVLVESAQFLKSARYVTKAAKSATHPSGYERRRALEPLIYKSLDSDTLRFAFGVNFFLYESVRSFFKGYLPDEQSVFIFAPLFDTVK